METHANELSDMALVIPALNPPLSMIELVTNLKEKFTIVIIVNDGSETSYNKIFSKIQNLGDNILLVSNKNNKGKGHALKKAFSFILENFKDVKGVVTADCDGQHSSDDIINVGLSFSKNSEQPIVLGVREFDNDVPFRSKFGNLIIRSLFRLQTGKFIIDTQTGLRALPRTFLNTCVKIPTNNYEFEMDMLITSIKQKIPISSISSTQPNLVVDVSPCSLTVISMSPNHPSEDIKKLPLIGFTLEPTSSFIALIEG